jgi:hypothetical protein
VGTDPKGVDLTLQQIIHAVATDTQTTTVLGLIILDLVLGVLAALKTRTFALSFVANIARNDVLGKAVPFFAVDAFAVVAGQSHIVVDQLDLTNIAHGMFVVIVAAMAGSVVSSLKDLGFDVLPPALGRGTRSSTTTG